MFCLKPTFWIAALLYAIALPLGVAQGAITDLTTWLKVTDPATPYMISTVDSSSQITINVADHAIATATDLGYQSVDGNTVATSTNPENAFSPATSFQIAIDYSLSFDNALGGLAIGFGIGEDINGENSGGIVLFTPNGTPIGDPGEPLALMGGRINDNNVFPALIMESPPLSGSMFISYDAVTGNVIGGLGGVGDSAPTYTAILAGIQQDWADAMLFPAFFVRSESMLTGQGWTSGTATAVFSNFRVIAVPEPSGIALLAWLGLVVPLVRRRLARASARSSIAPVVRPMHCRASCH